MTPHQALNAPATPSSAARTKELNIRVKALSDEWGLGFESTEDWSPDKNKNNGELKSKCLGLIRVCFWKNILELALDKFSMEATKKCDGWVHKPKGERGVTPRASDPSTSKLALSPQQRSELLHCLFEKLEGEKEVWVFKDRRDRERKEASPKDVGTGTKSLDTSSGSIALPSAAAAPRRSMLQSPGTTPSDRAQLGNFNDTPIPVKGLNLPESKRAREEPFVDILTNAKKARPSIGCSNNATTNSKPSASQRSKAHVDQITPNTSFASGAMPPPNKTTLFNAPSTNSSNAPSAPALLRANTSFTSDVTSVFSNVNIDSAPATQMTIPDDESLVSTRENSPISEPIPIKERSQAFTKMQSAPVSSSNYASSSFERRFGGLAESDILIIDGEAHISYPQDLSQGLEDSDLEDAIAENTSTKTDTDTKYSLSKPDTLLDIDLATSRLRESLRHIFPTPPPALADAPLHVIYEITRVFLYTGVPLSEFNAPVTSALKNYDTLWAFLRSLPVLQGKSLPEKCGRDAWAYTSTGYQRGFYALVFSGSLRFTFESSKPLFRLLLEPFKIDRGHRLGRHFGHDRVLELSFPALTDRSIPEKLRDIGEEGLAEICKWLVHSPHIFLNREWKPFDSKTPRQSKKKSRKSKFSNTEDFEPAFRLSFFAIAGVGFGEKADFSRRINFQKPPSNISIGQLLNRIRPTRKNKFQPFTKLAARTQLALSRTCETVQIPESCVRFLDDIKSTTGEVMNDGAGRISPKLAFQITQKLGLSYQPCAFQARLGEAKGLWIIDYTDTAGEDWIEVYRSQQKWTRSTKPNGESQDISHQFFEVLNYSSPLKSADLNQQLMPILIENSKDQTTMKKSIGQLLQDGLAQELENLQLALEDPQSFRKWVKENNPNIKERLKFGEVPYKAGMPAQTEEKLNVMLDAGFNPIALAYMRDMAWDVIKRKGEDLKEKLNITVGKSAYAYMVPDFWGVLEPGEVYMDFSNFTDDITSFASAVLKDQDILVARSPAHFISDIQKVRAVAKVELMGLKDIIIFSIKGDVPLASKLSGGDYDGDIAWVCWEPTIVNNFTSADVPDVPNLVKEGYIQKVSMTYEELVVTHPEEDPDLLFMRKSLEFNLRPSMLGLATIFKEDVSYTFGINSKETIYFCQLLSDLVDQAKQGYIFRDIDFDKFKKKMAPAGVRQPHHKSGYETVNSSYIIDYLKAVARDRVNSTLGEFHHHLEARKPPGLDWDEDLVEYNKEARKNAAKFSDWKDLISDLDEDIREIKDDWKKHFSGSRGPGDDEFDPASMAFILECFVRFQDIKPHVENSLTTSLVPTSLNPECTPWALLKASVLFGSYRPGYLKKFPWWMAGRQLLELKARKTHGVSGPPHVVVPSMFIIQKPDVSIIRQLRCQDITSGDGVSVTNIEELEALQDY